jgi:hypothetical protein
VSERRESSSVRAARLMELLGLTEDELCQMLAVDPLALLSGHAEQRAELPILLQLSNDAADQVGGSVLKRWVRRAGPHGRPIDALLARDFPRFEEAIEELGRRGFILRGG